MKDILFFVWLVFAFFGLFDHHRRLKEMEMENKEAKRKIDELQNRKPLTHIGI